MHLRGIEWSGRGLLWLAVAGACGGAPAGLPSTVAIVDSAGITLVRNMDASVDTLAIELVETFRLGTVDGPEETQFHLINGIATDASGRYYVIDQGTQSIRVYAPDGRFVRRFGGAGRGPGQFTFIGQLFLWRDTVHAADIRDARVSLFDTAGVHLTSFANLLPNGSRIRLLQGGSAGWYVADDSLLSGRSREQVGVSRQTPTEIKRIEPGLIERVARSREAADSLLVPVTTYAGMRVFGMLGSEGGSERFVLGNPPFFEPRPSHAIDARGMVYVAHGWPYVVDVFDANGELVRRISRAHDSVQVTDALVAEVLRRARAYYDTTSERRGASYHTYTERARMPAVGYVPITREMKASAEGWLWVRRADLDPEPARLEWSIGEPPRPTYWDVFDPDGTFRMMVRLPLRFTPHQVLPDAVIGVQRDELDVQYVVRYELRQADQVRNR